ncbi:MAG: phosphomannomutase/phosphoglucomutase [Phycisphaerales bacterium]|nr:phosphomannomutase/phosphoglucomutase [Phycisphaerales bacterium]
MLGKVFKAYDVRATYPRPLNEKVAWQVGHALAGHLIGKARDAGRLDPMGRHLVVGRDMRLSSPDLFAALTDGIRDAGGHVIDVGRVDTPFIYFAINHLDAAGGVQVTASHNPANYNGFKISGLGAKPVGSESGLEDIRREAALANRDRVDPQGGRLEARDLWAAYRDWLLSKLDPRILDGSASLKVAIDASNGMAGEMIPQVFGDVKGLEIIPIHFETNGEFVHEPNPLVDKNLQWTRDAVREHGADFGACFDGDADRCMVIDEQGGVVGCDMLLAWWVGKVLKANPGASVIYDLRSSRAVREAIEKAGGIPVESRVGHVFMKAALAASDAPIGGELSGHFYFQDTFGTDNGARAFIETCNQLVADGRPMSACIAPHDRYPRTGEMNFKVEDVKVALEAVANLFPDARKTELDGISLDTGDWWCNVRSSNTEPLLRFNLEAVNEETLQDALSRIQGVLGKPVDH